MAHDGYKIHSDKYIAHYISHLYKCLLVIIMRSDSLTILVPSSPQLLNIHTLKEQMSKSTSPKCNQHIIHTNSHV